MNPDPIEYRAPETHTPISASKRPLHKRILLLFIWILGIIMWVFYLGLAAVILFRVI